MQQLRIGTNGLSVTYFVFKNGLLLSVANAEHGRAADDRFVSTSRCSIMIADVSQTDGKLAFGVDQIYWKSDRGLFDLDSGEFNYSYSNADLQTLADLMFMTANAESISSLQAEITRMGL
jgi:hypothetical protein